MSCRLGPEDMELSLEDKADLKRAGGSVRTLAESGPSRLSRVLRLGLIGQPRPDIRVPRRPIPYKDHPKLRVPRF
ncbi:hypothetical protein B296_00054266 [Ensete ventricosum]|uniref:Uncharacterized protein n=1 Tax=Ensete ventricosum TaxID=4639 RepID=A0A426X2K6_ENSVE|nr:hypothetical protein B296_00054266 [Ensete ventricosum]